MSQRTKQNGGTPLVTLGTPNRTKKTQWRRTCQGVVEATENIKHEQEKEKLSSWRVMQAFPWLLALLKIEASPETLGRIPMTLSSELRDAFSSQRCLDSRVNDRILMRDYMTQWLRVQALELGCPVYRPPHLFGLLDKQLTSIYFGFLVYKVREK